MDIRWQDLVHSPLAESEVECVCGRMVQGKHAPCTPYATRRCYAGAVGELQPRTHAEQANEQISRNGEAALEQVDGGDGRE